MINIILSGGSGTRLWPLSRTMLPKQFVRLFDNESLFQQSVKRNESVCSYSLIVSNADQYFLAVDQYQQVCKHPARFVLEPEGRNTAPAIALACMLLDDDDLVLVTTSDHLVRNKSAYERAVLLAKKLATEGNLVTFGIQPDYPETGFGYIEASGNDVLSFKEKPDAVIAQSYIDQGNYYWNSGMFCFKAGVFLKELKHCSPAIYEACEKAVGSVDSRGAGGATNGGKGVSEVRIPLEVMQAIPEESIDYAVMEKSENVKVVPCDMGWSDLGSYDALFAEFKDEETQNVILPIADGAPEPICIDSKNSLIVSRDRQIALVDVEDLLVVDTSDAILISKKGSSQKVKNVVSAIKEKQPGLAEIHRLAHRPWGTYEVLVDSLQYKVKRIVVKPDSKLSLQKHFHRNEHWIVVSGTAKVTVDDKVFLVRPNESTYIQMGQVHRLENNGKIDLVMVEVQVGEYTGEDDIVRIEDVYGR